MLKIAVVDDEVECIDKLALILEQYFQAKQIIPTSISNQACITV